MAKKTVSKATSNKVVNRKKGTEKKEYVKGFWFNLRDEEIVAMARNTGEVASKLNKDREAFKSVKTEWTQKIKDKETELDTMHATMKAGKEWREVDCVEITDFNKKEIRWEVKGKVMGSRDLSNDEMQMGLPLPNRGEEAGKVADAIRDTKTKGVKTLQEEAQEFTDKKKKGKPGALKVTKQRKETKKEKAARETAEVIQEQTNPRTAKSAVSASP